jgi:NADH:ubiquinone oxidoreductase subunit C
MALASAAEAIGRAGDRFRGIQELKVQLEEQRRRAEEDLLRTSASQIHFSPSPAAHPARESPTLHAYVPYSQPRRNSLDQSKVLLSFGDLDATAASANSLLGMTTTSISTNSRAVLAALRALQDKIRRVESEKSALESEVARLKGEIAMQHEGSERSRVESTSRSETQIAELQRVVNHLRDEVASTRAQADASRREVNSTHRQEIDSLNEVVAGLRSDNTDLRVRLQQKDDELRVSSVVFVGAHCPKKNGFLTFGLFCSTPLSHWSLSMAG